VKVSDSNLLDEVTRRLEAEFHPEQIFLFGSRAWGEPDDDSDLDLLVVVPESAETPVRRAQRAHRCLKGIEVAKDILVKTRSEFERFRNVPASLEAEILKRGRLIYG
jgi:predicted nucleotidyltransferase